jgi:hypothetical protein
LLTHPPTPAHTPQASSPSSTKFGSVRELGAPEVAGAALVAQYLVEFQSTRLGVRRDASLLSATPRTGADGKEYLDVEINVQSFAVEQQYGVTAAERGPPVREWDRRLLTTLGVANGRLYSLRLQCNEDSLGGVRDQFRLIQDSFRAVDIV